MPAEWYGRYVVDDARVDLDAPASRYRRRIADDELDELIAGLPAVALDGPKAVGKTATALRRAATVYRLDDEAVCSIGEADPSRLLDGERPVLIDEWQRLPASFDRVRRAVDDGAAPGSFLLTGSASPTEPPTHSGAGRIVQVRLRPMALAERGVDVPTISLRALLEDRARTPITGHTDVNLERYVHEILASGFPGLRGLSGRLGRAQLDGYIDRIIDRDFEELGRQVRRPGTLRRWMQAYAAATATTASYEKLRDAATSGHGEKPARTTTQPYRDVLERLWILDPVPAWLPTRSRLARLAAPAKHHLADPALAARLLGVDADTLLQARPVGPPIAREGTLLGALFESLVTLSVRVYAQAAEARTAHLRTWSGDREIDLIVERGSRVLAIEVKLGHTPDERDVRHLLWLRNELGDDLADAIVITTGQDAYRRADGIAVVPAALLGP
jgi:predicted AAA+ superfamily ATPase